MNQRQLESFLAIAKHGSFAAAAERLFITQSAISARIKELEDDLGVELFDRSLKKVQLTIKGRELVQYAEQISVLFDEIRSKVGTAGAQSGVVRIGVVELVAITWMSKLLAVLRKEFPAVTVEFEVALRPPLLERMRSGNLDMAIIIGEVTLEKCLGQEFASAHLGNASFAWMASWQFNVGNGILHAKDLRKLPLIYQGTESFMNGVISDWLSHPDSRKQHGTSCNGLGSIVSLVEAGVGIGLLPVTQYEPLLKAKKLKILRTEPAGIDIPFSVLYPQRGEANLFARIAELCVQVSTFARPEKSALRTKKI